MEEYSALASVYDEFMDNVDYRKWADFIKKILTSYDINDGLVLDLGCGTGKMTELLADEGYDMTGVDASDEMLQEAVQKREYTKKDILYLNQDMREFELYGTMRAIVSTCDCINYITDTDELKEVFRLVNNYLDPGGLFIFDFNTRSKYRKIGEASIAENREDASFIWENYYDEDDSINEYQLTLFLPVGNGLYKKYEEVHIQRGYDIDEIKRIIEESGMKFVKAYDDYSDDEPCGESERIVVVAREHGK